MGNQQSSAQGTDTVTNLLQTYCVLRSKDENLVGRTTLDPKAAPILDVRSSGVTPHIVEYEAPEEGRTVKHKAVKSARGRNHHTGSSSPLSKNVKTQPSQKSASPSTPKIKGSADSSKPRGSLMSTKSKGSKGQSTKSGIQIKDGKVVRSLNEQPSPIQVYNILSAKEPKREAGNDI